MSAVSRHAGDVIRVHTSKAKHEEMNSRVGPSVDGCKAMAGSLEVSAVLTCT